MASPKEPIDDKAVTVAATPPSGPVVTSAATMLPPIRLKPDVSPADRYREQSAASSDALVVGGDPAYEYHYFLPGDFPTTVAATGHRQRLVDEGFAPRNGPYYSGAPCSEYVSSHGEAEIWRRSKSDADAAFLAALTRSVLTPLWAAAYHRHPRNALPPGVETAMYAYHGIIKPDQLPEGVKRPTERQLRDLVWSQVKPHPGGSRPNLYPWSS